MTLEQLSAAAIKEAEELWEKCCLADLYYKPFGEPDLMQTPLGILANALHQVRTSQLVEVQADVEQRCPSCGVKFSEITDVDAHIAALAAKGAGDE